MANMYLTSTAKFKPFSYQEMVAPVVAYKEAYEKADAELNALYEDAASKAFNFASQDVKEKATYDDMMNKLRLASDSLASGDINSFKAIRDINKEYRQTMLPIQQKMTKRAELAKEQRDIQKANPYIRFDKDYSQASLDDITGSSTYNAYDLSTIYTNAAKDTASLIAGLYRDQVGTPSKIEGTNYYSVVSGYGFTPDEWDEDMQNKESALYKYVQTAKEKATKGITDPTIKQEIELGVEETIRNNIGKFEQTTIKGDTTSMSDLFREAEFNYKYTIDPVTKEIRLSDRYQMDRGYTKNPDGSWSPPSQSQQAVYQAGPQNPITLNADELTSMLGVQSPWISRAREVKKSKEFDKIKNKASLEEIRGNKSYSGKKFDPNNENELEKDSLVRKWIIDTVGENNINNYMYLYNENTGEVHILPQKQHKVTDNTLPQEAQSAEVKQPSSTDEDGE